MRILFISFLACAMAGCGTQPAPPNVVVILADDLGYGDIARYNPATKIATPNLNRLADEGMRLTDAHSPSAVCTPTRYGLLTGRYAWRTHLRRGVLQGYSPNLIDTTRLTLAKLFREHGYSTGAVGKWHLGLGNRDSTRYDRPLHPGPNAAGFDYFFGIPSSLDFAPYVYVVNTGLEEAPTDTIGASRHRRQEGGGFWRAGAIAPGFRHAEVLPRIAEEAVRFVEEHAKKGPFFLYVPLSAPHTPWLPAEEFSGASGAGYYGDFVAQVDHVVGRLLHALDAADRETFLVFTSDNGAHWPESDRTTFTHDANGPWRGQKADIWEGGHRVPFLVRWPGFVEPGSTSSQLVSLTDLMATSAALLGASLPQDAGEDSFDFLPVLLGSGPGLRRTMVHHSLNGMFAIREGRWKLVLGRGSGGFTAPRFLEPAPGEPAGQLYDLAADPAESQNLYDAEPLVVSRLSTLLEHYKNEGGTKP